MADEKKPVDGTEETAGTDEAKTPETELTPETVADAVVTEEDDADALGQDTSEDEVAAEDQPEAETDEGDSPEEESAEPVEDAPTEEDEIISDEEVVAAETAAEEETPPPAPEPEAPAPPAPVVQEKIVERKGGFVPMLLGGVVAAALGYGASAYQSGTLPFLSGGDADSFEADTTAALQSQAGEIEALKGAVQQASDAVSGIDLSGLQSAVSDLATRLDAAAGQIDGLSAQLGNLDTRLGEMEKRPVADAVSPEAIAAYERELEDVRQAIATQRQEVEDMTRQALEAEANAEDQAALSKARAALSEVMSALTSGAPYEAALGVIAENGTEVPAVLSGPAADGVPTLAALTEAFPPAAREALSAARQTEAESETGTGRLATFLADQLGARSVTAREGDSPDAVLSRAEAALRSGDLGQTLTELDALPEAAKAPLSGWIAEAGARRDAVAAAEAVAQDLNKE